MQRLSETYDQCHAAPQFEKQPPLPVGHTFQRAHIEIVLDGQGRFRRAAVVSKEDGTTRIPCTEESGGRTGKKPANHPLCDKLQYVAGDFLDFGGRVTSGFLHDPTEPHRAYVADLTAWASSSGQPKLLAILAYVKRGRLVHDLVEAQILPLDGKGMLLNRWIGGKEKAPPIFKVLPSPPNPDSSFVRWRVELPGDPASGTWEDPDLVRSWTAHYASRQTERGVCMVTGAALILAKQHPKRLRGPGDQAKLISSDDTTGYTFRGRLVDADQACGVGFDVTQKAHSALQWLIQRQGYHNGDQVIVAWAVAGTPIPDPFQNTLTLLLAADEIGKGHISGDEGAQPVGMGDVGQAFARRLKKTIAGYRATLGAAEGIVVTALDSATKGRLAMTFYRELTGSEFLDRVEEWHRAFAWWQDFGKDPDSKRPLRFIGAPSPGDIAESVFGQILDKKRKLHKATVERLLPCIIDGRPLPRDLMESAVRRTCNRAAFEKDRKGGEPLWEKNLGIACALFRGFFKEREYDMTLETGRTSRDYLYGRLLAIGERIERMALNVAGEGRDTNAARLMQRFADHPYTTWRSIELALTPYKTRLRAKRPGFLYNMERRLDEVTAVFKGEDFMDDRKLTGEFLLGYHCERQAPRSSETNTAKPDEAGDDETT